jgi:hypothetical protein
MDLFILFAVCAATAAAASVIYSPSFQIAGDGLTDGTDRESLPVRPTNF